MSRIIVLLLNCKRMPSPLTASNRAVIREGYFKLNLTIMKRKNVLISTSNHFFFFLFLCYSDFQHLKKQSDLIQSPSKDKKARRFDSNYTKCTMKALGSRLHNVTGIVSSAWLCQKNIIRIMLLIYRYSNFL